MEVSARPAREHRGVGDAQPGHTVDPPRVLNHRPESESGPIYLFPGNIGALVERAELRRPPA